MSTPPEQFSLRVERASFVPDEQAVRELTKQLQQELEGDPKLRTRFGDNPREVFCERGVPLDLQRELLVASGMAGAEGDCLITCAITNFQCGSTIVFETA
jgi:hypothetical protein